MNLNRRVRAQGVRTAKGRGYGRLQKQERTSGP